MNDFELRTEYIELGQLLKSLRIAMSGGEAKIVLGEGTTKVNDEIETRRGRKLRDGDIVTLADGAVWRIVG